MGKPLTVLSGSVKEVKRIQGNKKFKRVRKKLAPDETETKWEGVSVFQQTVGNHRPVS
jgi:hypothetical protein